MKAIAMLSGGAAALWVAVVFLMLGGGVQAAPAPAPVPTTPRERFAVDVLAALGNRQPTAETVAFIVAWTLAEDRGDDALRRNNPLNTTQGSAAQTMTINADGVKGYADYASGVEATITTLTNGRYDEIVAGLRSNDPARALAGLSDGVWGTNAASVERIWKDMIGSTGILATYHKCPYTQTMEYGADFYATAGGGFWQGQYGGMHLGVDFTGIAGDPVYAPFDMTIESIGFYADAARYGKNIQARFADGTLYYAGHLIDVYVQQGDRVPACTVIGTLGATDYAHVHVKLGAPAAPVPCEGSPPGDGGCIDPLEYWRTH